MGCAKSKERRVTELGRTSRNESLSFRFGKLDKYVQRQLVAVGWPKWLVAAAGEAVRGWIPLREDNFQIMEKIGEGTYSKVFKARDLKTGKLVALKKVRFNSLDRKSVKFAAREIVILRKLDHPNITKLQGLITPRLSSTLYLVFEYMEHDFAGLLGNPNINFSQPQIKCYMKQLLSAVEYFHLHGVMHRDIKGSNLLVNNEGTLKVADFGLANFITSERKKAQTNHVVTLWYRPPELLLGSTNYGSSVDLWSVGCVFGELLLRKVIFQGNSEDQLNKIFKLCGNPPTEFWNRTKPPFETLRPQLPCDGCFQDSFKDLPPTSVNLLQTLLSIEPDKRGTAASALSSEYFKTLPYACEPSSLPKYPPSKEIHAKKRAEELRKRKDRQVRRTETMKQSRKPLEFPAEGSAFQTQNSHRVRSRSLQIIKEEKASQGNIFYSGPLQVSTSNAFAWAKNQKDNTSIRLDCRTTSRRHSFNALDSSVFNSRNKLDTVTQEKKEFCRGNTKCRGLELLEIYKASKDNHWSRFDRQNSFDTSDEYTSRELPTVLSEGEDPLSKRSNLSYPYQRGKVEFSESLMSQLDTVD
ncbi:protein IMPAIRED IN BABA-INDUCED STERILITY 1-like isoform X2 [Vicia villosa]|uniref:protein IMPAIRED IN BABA-INDUCED STERILITY 1-like isoform X2 n=1 Tax=Vicia villosa TaxID=3911 RepID=UPI00273C376A|nr:protein IMPAIRED IN BABA-INDUCED STERILITY 1-like isoform X2 [Vicia villosa]